MAMVRGFGFRVGAGPDRCWAYELAWEEPPDQVAPVADLRDRAGVRVLSECDRLPTATWLGSGICAWHEAQTHTRAYRP